MTTSGGISSVPLAASTQIFVFVTREGASPLVHSLAEDLAHRVTRDPVLRGHLVSPQALSSTCDELTAMPEASLKELKIKEITKMFTKHFQTQQVSNLMEELSAKLAGKTITNLETVIQRTDEELALNDPETLDKMTLKDVFEIFKAQFKLVNKPQVELKTTISVESLIANFERRVAKTTIPNNPNYSTILQRTRDELESMDSLKDVNVLSIFKKHSDEIKRELESIRVQDDTEITPEELKEIEILDKVETLKDALNLDESHNEAISHLEIALEQKSLEQLEQMTPDAVRDLFMSLAPPQNPNGVIGVEGFSQDELKKLEVDTLILMLSMSIDKNPFRKGSEAIINTIKTQLEAKNLTELKGMTEEDVVEMYAAVEAQA